METERLVRLLTQFKDGETELNSQLWMIEHRGIWHNEE